MNVVSRHARRQFSAARWMTIARVVVTAAHRVPQRTMAYPRAALDERQCDATLIAICAQEDAGSTSSPTVRFAARAIQPFRHRARWHRLDNPEPRAIARSPEPVPRIVGRFGAIARLNSRTSFCAPILEDHQDTVPGPFTRRNCTERLLPDEESALRYAAQSTRDTRSVRGGRGLVQIDKLMQERHERHPICDQSPQSRAAASGQTVVEYVLLRCARAQPHTGVTRAAELRIAPASKYSLNPLSPISMFSAGQPAKEDPARVIDWYAKWKRRRSSCGIRRALPYVKPRTSRRPDWA